MVLDLCDAIGMRRVAAGCLLVLALLAGCNTRQRIGGGATVVTLVGVGLTYSNQARDDDEVGTRGKVGIAMILTGLVTLFVVAALDETANEPAPREIKIARAPSELDAAEQRAAQTAQQKRAQAWELTKRAHAAARANDCPQVTELSAQVGALDPELFADVFMKDLAVQRCLTPATPPPAPASVPVLPPVAPTPATP